MIAHASHGMARRGDCIVEVMDCCLGIASSPGPTQLFNVGPGDEASLGIGS